VRAVVSVVVVASLAFLGTMFDNYFAFAAQLVVTDRAHVRRVAAAQALGVAVVLVIAAGVGSLLAPIPVRWIGVLCVAPWALAVHAWRHRADLRPTTSRRGATTTFVVTLALSGDNLAVWIPLVRANGTWRGVGVVAVFVAWELIFVSSAVALARHPRVVAWGTKWGPALVPWIYLALGVLILVECHTFS